MTDHYVEMMFIVFGMDISLVLWTHEISLHKNNSHDLHIVISHSLVLVIVCPPIDNSSSLYIHFYFEMEIFNRASKLNEKSKKCAT